LDLCIGMALALMVRVWELGWPARVGLVPLVLLQLVWGGDAMLFYGKKQLNAAVELVSTGYEGGAEGRLWSRSVQRQVTRATPKNAVILGRNYKGLLGLDRSVLSDVRAGQDYVSYANLKDTRELYDLLKARGVTHLLYPRNERRPERWNNTILFTALFAQSAENTGRFGKLMVGELSKQAPPSSAPFLVAVSGIRGVADGVWAVEQLDFDPRDPERFSPLPKPRYRLAEVKGLLGQVQALLLGRRKSQALGEEELSQFEQTENWNGEQLWLRRR
jgi:hypothetical protein